MRDMRNYTAPRTYTDALDEGWDALWASIRSCGNWFGVSLILGMIPAIGPFLAAPCIFIAIFAIPAGIAERREIIRKWEAKNLPGGKRNEDKIVV